jgi:hypothetical protein
MKIKKSSSGNSLISALRSPKEVNTPASTQNGALTNSTSGSSVLNLFGLGGAARAMSEPDLQSLFEKSYFENDILSLKTAFYLRDVRGGQGERKTFRRVLQWLAFEKPEVVAKNLENIAFYGRWDDVVTLLDTPVGAQAFALIEKQLVADIQACQKNGSVSLLAKWLPSINTSSKLSRKSARGLAKKLNITEREYRKTLSKLRSQIDIVEKKMCAGDWAAIDYSKVPSKASLLYRKAYGKRDTERYGAFLSAVEKGEATIKAATLYPYDLVNAVRKGADRTAEAQWKALPDYLADNPHNGLVVCDVSGSMSCGINGESGWSTNGVSCLDVAISLAVYFAERNVGAFKDYFMSFSNDSKLNKLKGNTLRDKIDSMDRRNWDMNTNLQSAFDNILKAAVDGNVPQSEMPSTLYIVSDMEFDCVKGKSSTNYRAIKDKYAKAGYQLPSVVFWNVSAKSKQVPVTVHDENTALVSGCSPAILKSILGGKVVSPYDLMLDVLNNERYDRVVA